jgi:hypothetical protein
MEPSEHELTSGTDEVLEPIDDWIHLQPSLDEERKGRIYLPVNVEGARLTRAIVLAAGDSVSDLRAGDVVLVLASKTIEMRDGSQLARREFVVARMR